jgi:hypothetical protein
MIVQRRDALSGVSLLSCVGAGHGADGMRVALAAPAKREAGPVTKPWPCRYAHSILLSYCPCTSPSACDAVSRLSAFPHRVAGSARARPRSGLTFAHFGFGLFRSRNAKWLAAYLILRFSRLMRNGDIAGSKLSACSTRPQGRRTSAIPVGQLGKGGGPPLHPPCRLGRHAETVPVSTPFGLGRGGAPSSFGEVRP